MFYSQAFTTSKCCDAAWLCCDWHIKGCNLALALGLVQSKTAKVQKKKKQFVSNTSWFMTYNLVWVDVFALEQTVADVYWIIDFFSHFASGILTCYTTLLSYQTIGGNIYLCLLWAVACLIKVPCQYLLHSVQFHFFTKVDCFFPFSPHNNKPFITLCYYSPLLLLFLPCSQKSICKRKMSELTQDSYAVTRSLIYLTIVTRLWLFAECKTVIST